MDYSFLDEFVEKEKEEQKVDYDKILGEKPKQDDTAIRSWLKSTYTGPQKVEDIPITPQLVERFERQNQPEPPAPQLSQREMAEAMTPLGQLGGGLQNVLQGGTQAGARLADLAVKAYFGNPMLAPTPEMGVMVGANKDDIQKSLGQIIAGSAELEKERGLSGTAGDVMHQIGAMGVDIPVKYSNPAGMAIMAGEGFAEGSGVSARDYANQIEAGGGNQTIRDEKTLLDALKSGAISTTNALALMGLGKVATALPQGIARPVVEAAGMAGISAIQGGDPVAGGIMGLGFGAKKINAPQRPLFKPKGPTVIGQSPKPKIEQKPPSKPTKLEDTPGPRVIGQIPPGIVQNPMVPQAKSPEKGASGGISEPTKGVLHGGVGGEGMSIEELNAQPAVRVTFDSYGEPGQIKSGPGGEIRAGGLQPGKNERIFVGDPKTKTVYDVTNGTPIEVVDPKTIKIATDAGIFLKYKEAPENVISDATLPTAEERAALGIKDVPASKKIEPTKPAGVAKEKELWEMTKDEFDNSAIYQGTSDITEGRTNYWTPIVGYAAEYAGEGGGYPNSWRGKFGKNHKLRVALKKDIPIEQFNEEGYPIIREPGKSGVETIKLSPEEYWNYYREIEARGVGERATIPPGEYRDAHKYLVKKALSEGRPVPPEVLKDYPDLVKAEPPTPPTVNNLPTPEATKPVEPIAEPVAEKPSGMIGEKIKTVLDRMPVAFKNAKKAYLDWVNKAQDIDNLSKFAKDNNIKIDETLDPILATRRKWGAVGTANSVLMDGTFKISRGNVIRTGEGFKPIIKDFDSRSTIKDKKLRIAKLDEFLQANRTITDLASAEKATPKQIEAAQKKLNALEMSNPVEYKNIRETADRLYDYQKRTLNMLVESGIMSQESYDNILAKNKAYVPFERILPDVMDNLTVSGKLRSTPRKVIFSMKGSEKEVKNTPESIVKKTYEMVDAAETNYVNRSISQFADALPELIKKQKYYPGRKPGKNEMVVYEDGKPSIYSVSDGIFQGMKVLDSKSSNIFMKLLTAPKKMLQVGATATPEFAIRNLMRDQTGAMINTKVKFRPFVDTISSLADIMGKKDIYKEYMASGAGMQGYADLNRNALTKTLEHIRGNKTKLEKMNIISHLGELSSLLETATRLGTYKAARKSGASVGKSSYISRESTLDFSRAGSTGEKVNKVIAFFNAGIQGTDRMARAAKSDPVGFTAKAIASVTIPEILFQLINKDDEEFTNAPSWRKDLFWHIPGLNAWIPKPFVVGQAFGSVPGRFMEYAISKDPHSFDNILNVALEGFSPVGMDAVGALMPTAIKPWLENMFNYNFFTQTNLFPEYKEKLDPSERSSKFTKETFKMLGEALGISPAKMENLFRGYTAGLGQYAMQASDALINSFNDDIGRPPTEPSNIPVVKGFVGRRTSSSPEKLNQFYRAYEDIDTAYARYKKLKESGKPGESGKYRDEHPEIKYRPDFNRYRGIMSDYGKRIDKINEMKIPDAEKRKRLIEVERKRLTSLDKILKLYSGEVNLMEVPKTLRGILQ